jgi:hypothetical protein
MPELPAGAFTCNKGGTVCVVNRIGPRRDHCRIAASTTTRPSFMQGVTAKRSRSPYLKAELAKLQAIKGCAKVEVLPRGGKN